MRKIMKNAIKKSLSICLSFILALSLFYTALPSNSAKVAKAVGYGLSNPRINSDGVATWDCIYFGNYWQNDTNGDGKADQNDAKQPIKWRVLSVDGDDAFLLADQNLDCQPYHKESGDATWETCTLRQWLNHDFYQNAFDGSEQSAVQTMTVVNGDNQYYGTEGGNNTSDKVYLLSLGEASNPVYGFCGTYNTGSKTREAKNTEYVKECEGSIGDSAGIGWWWLRSPGRYSYRAAYVQYSGYVRDDGTSVDSDGNVVRPALHLNLTSSKWSKAGTVSASGAGSTEATAAPVPTNGSGSGDESQTVKETGADFSIGGIQSGSAEGAVGKFFPGDWKMSLANYPVEISKSTDLRDGSFTIKLAVGIGRSDLLDNETEWNKYKKNINDASDNLDAYAKQYQAKKKVVVDPKGFKKMPSVSVMGYYEQKYDKNGNLVSSTGKVAADASWKASTTWSFATPIGPMYLKLQGGAKIKGKVGPKYDYKQKKWSILDGSLTLQPNVSLEGGYGIDKVATIGAKGSADVPIQLIPFSKASIDAAASVHVYVVFLLDAEYTLAKCTIPLWNTTGKKAGNSSGLYLESSGDMKILDTSFVKERTDWQGTVKKSKIAGKRKLGKSKAGSEDEQNETVLQEGILTTSLPIMKEIDGKKVMIFQELDTTRSTLNGSVLKYSVYEAGVWSEPKAVRDDGTSDFYADMKEIDGKLALTWQNEKKQLGSDAGEEDAEAALQEMGENSEICYAEFDSVTNTFANAQSITDNAVADMMPQLAKVSGKTAVAWVRNDAGSMMQERGKNKIIISMREGNAFPEEKILCQTADPINQYVVADADAPQAYYVSKKEGEDAVVCNQDGDRISELQSVEDGEVHVSAIRQEDGKIVYLSNGEVYEYEIESGETEAYQAGESAIGDDAVYCSNGDKAGFIWSEYDSETEIGKICVSMKTDDGYSEPVILSEKAGTIYRHISPILSSDGVWQVLANAEDTGTNRNSLVYIEKETGIKIDLQQARIDEYDKNEDGLTGVNYLVTNTSDVTVETLEMEIELEDGTVLQKEIDASILPGESQLGTAYVDLSGIDNKQNITISLYAKGQKDISQNKITETIGLTDVQVKGSVEETSEQATVTVQLENTSMRKAEVDLKVSEDSKVLAENTNLVLAAGEKNTIMMEVPKSKIAYSHNDAAYLELKAEVAQGDYLEDNNVDYVVLYKEKTTNPETKKNVQAKKVTSKRTIKRSTVSKPGKTSIRTAKNKKGKKISLSWKKIKGAKGYQIQYAGNKKFKKKKTKWTRKTKYTIKKLKKKKTYYIRIRAYKLNGSKKVYGSWSKVKKVKIKK